MSPLPCAAAAKAATVEVRTLRLRVVGASLPGAVTTAGGCWGAVLVAMASASSGVGRLDFNGAFTSLRPYVVTCCRHPVHLAKLNQQSGYFGACRSCAGDAA